MLVLAAQSLEIAHITDDQGIQKNEVMEYQGWHFSPIASFNDRNSAELACRRQLDAGIFAVIVQDNAQYSLWCSNGD
ncbi:MAG: hypothetical protein WCO45_14595 [Pseudanabaena sp. ELA607]